MAQDSIDKIINIRFNYNELVTGWSKASQAIEENKRILADIKKEYQAGLISLEDYRKAELELTSTTKALTDERRLYEKEIQNNIKVEKEQIGSLNQLRANLNNLISQYNKLSSAERESSKGNLLADHIKSQREAIKEAEAAIGDYRSNVGNYENAIANAIPTGQNFLLQLADTAQKAGGVTNVIKGTATALSNLIKQMAAFIATPIGAAIAAIYAAYKAASFSIGEVNARINENEELFYLNARAMTASEALVAAYTNSVDRMSESLISANAKMKTLWETLKIFAKNRIKYGLFGYYETYKQINEAAELKPIFDEIVKKREERDKLYRDNIVRIAELENEIAEARLKANDRLNNSDEERAIYAQEAYDKTKELYDLKQKLADIDLEIAELEDNPTGKSVEINNRTAELRAASISVKGQRDSALRELLERINETRGKLSTQEDDVSSNLPNFREAIDAWTNEQREAIRKGSVDIANDFEKLLSEIEKELSGVDKDLSQRLKEQYKNTQDEYTNRILSARLAGGDDAAQQETINILREQIKDIEDFQWAYEAMGMSATEVDNMRLEKLLQLKDAIKGSNDTAYQGMEQQFQAVSQLAGALSGLAEESGASTGVVAALGIAQAIASMGAALSKAFSSSATVWDGIAGAVSAIATITTVIAQMKSLNSSAASEANKYADGGLVTGPGSGTSDSIPAMLSNGEAVMTARAVIDWGPVLSMMNVSSGGNAIPTQHLPEQNSGMLQLEQMFERALRRMPNPVVSVKDINTGQRRVQVQDNLARYKAGRGSNRKKV